MVKPISIVREVFPNKNVAKKGHQKQLVRLNAETKEQREAKLETERDNGIDDENRHPSEDNIFMLKEDKGTNREIGLSQKIGFNIGLILNQYKIQIVEFLRLARQP